MKYFPVLTLALMITLTLSACGVKAAPPPTLSAVDMQNTSIAVASTMIAETQAAIPTATAPAPTATVMNTLVPITAFVPSPAPAELTLTSAPNSNSGGGDPCLTTVLPPALEGTTVKIRISNSTKASVNVSVYLNRTVPPIVCGYRAYFLEPGGSVVINDLVEGCFTLWAWNPDPKTYFMVTNGAASCIDSSYPVAFDISTSSIKLR
jgi:hypothetical protein